MTVCTYIVCLVCLVANGLLYPLHDIVEYDKHLSTIALLFVETIVLQTTDERLKKLRDACEELMVQASFICQEEALEDE